MSIHILAVLTDAATAAICLDAAQAAARNERDVTLHALYVDVDPDKIVAAAEEIDLQMLRDAREGSAVTRRKDVEMAFEDWRAAHPFSGIALTVRVGQEKAVLVDEVSGAELVVLAHAHNLDNSDALHTALFSLNTPILLVPPGWKGEPWSHVAIAWGGSEAAEHAVVGALFWLARADAVSVLTIGDDVPHLWLREDLGLAGIHAIVEHRARGHGSLGEQIIALAHELGADALVAGAYRHNAVIEWLAGGTTRHLVDHADLPLFLAH